MKNRLFVLLTAMVCGCVTGCTTVKHMNDISQVSYTSDAGTILPELQWHEQITITKDRILLTRNGRVADTQVNEGSWDVAADGATVAALFEQLEGVDCATIERIEPDDPPDGGGAESYTVVYGRNGEFSLAYDPGVTYTGGSLLVAPIRALIEGLDLPDEAASRYKVALP